MHTKIFVASQYMFMIGVIVGIIELSLDHKLEYGAFLLLLSIGIMLQAVGAKYLDQFGDEKQLDFAGDQPQDEY